MEANDSIKEKTVKQFRYCLMIFKRSELGNRNINYEYTHFKKSDEKEAKERLEKGVNP